MGGDVAGAVLHGVSPANHGCDTPGGPDATAPWQRPGRTRNASRGQIPPPCPAMWTGRADG